MHCSHQTKLRCIFQANNILSVRFWKISALGTNICGVMWGKIRVRGNSFPSCTLTQCRRKKELIWWRVPQARAFSLSKFAYLESSSARTAHHNRDCCFERSRYFQCRAEPHLESVPPSPAACVSHCNHPVIICEITKQTLIVTTNRML